MNIDESENLKPRFLGRRYVREVLKQKVETFKNKPLHGYFRKKTIEIEDVDQELSEQWTNKKCISSHFEVCVCVIQEIGTRDWYKISDKSKRMKKQPATNKKCRLCKVHVEDLIHVISNCSKCLRWLVIRKRDTTRN